MKRLFFIRHGQTDMNVSGHLSGHSESLLTDEGKKQATVAAQHARGKLPSINLIISSPLGRAQETAKLIALELGYPVKKIETSNLLIERNFGVLEGVHAPTYFKTHNYQHIDSADEAETIEQLQVRAKMALDYLRSRTVGNILIVSHGAFGRALRREVNHLPYTHEYEEFKPIDNAEIVELI